MQYFKNKLTRKLINLLITFACLSLSVVAYASLVVIGNPALKFKKLNQHQLESLYLGRPTSAVEHLTPYNQPNRSRVFNAFNQEVLGWGPGRLSSYWSSQVFSGFAQQPAVISDDQAAIQIVEHNPNAVAYVNSESLANVGTRVKVIYGNYKIPIRRRKSLPKNQATHLYTSSSNNGYMTALSNDPAADNSSNISGPTNDPDTHLAQQLTELNNTPNKNMQNIWTLIAAHMTLQYRARGPEVQHWIMWFQHHPNVLRTMTDNATPYLYYIYQQTRRRHMPAEFALLPMIESGYNPRAYSYAGAAGLWQLMPGTASGYGMAIDWWYDARHDIMTSTNAGLNYLVSLHRHMKTWFLAAAAYNVGPGALDASIHRNKIAGKPTDFWSLTLPRQTEQYVPKLLAISAIIANPSKYGIRLPFVPDRPFFGSVTLTSQMDLQEIAKLSGVSVPVIKSLNPGLQRWATAPKGRFTLLLPVMSVENFKNNLDQVLGKTHVSWAYYRVSPGNTLASIAQHYGTTVQQLEKVNNMHSARVKPGHGILVPVYRHQTYTRLAGVSGTVKEMQNAQEKILNDALKRAVKSQKKALPAEVTGQPIKSSDSLKSLLGKLYGPNS